MPANYDKIAGVYDLISKLVFGKSIIKAQLVLLDYIPANSSILIAGGGTGWILEEISRKHASGLNIDCIDISAQMIAISKKRDYRANAVNFTIMPVEHFTGTGLYDVILTPFVLDNFTADKMDSVFNHLHTQLKSNGLWLYADFVYDENKGTLWQKLLLKVMYLFFRITCNIETNELINMEGYFATRYKKLFEAGYYFQFIKAVAYRKE